MNQLKLIDTHAHLADSKYDADRDLIIKRAREAGVFNIIEIACEMNLWENALEVLRLNPEIYGCFGLHPHEAKMFSASMYTMLEDLGSRQRTVGIGETGLDYFYDHSPRDVQKRVFVKHIELAIKLNKPVVIHCRQAYPELLEILVAEQKNTLGKIKGVVHCFAGNLNEAKTIIDLGLYIGIDGPVTYPNAKVLKEVVANIELKHMVVETDSPYLPPQEFRGQRNEPSYLSRIVEEISKIKGISLEETAKTTTENAKTLFCLPD